MKSNHPLTILRYLPNTVNKRFLDLSCNEVEYAKAKPLYETALNKNRNETTMTYTKNNKKQQLQTTKTELAILYGSIYPIGKMLKPTSESFFFP